MTDAMNLAESISARPLLETLPTMADDGLQIAPSGLYQTSKREDRTAYDIVTDESFTGECALIARVCESAGRWPWGAEHVSVRPDGKWIIYQWVRA